MSATRQNNRYTSPFQEISDERNHPPYDRSISALALGDDALAEKFSALKAKLHDLHRRNPRNNLTNDKEKLKKILLSLRDHHFADKYTISTNNNNAPYTMDHTADVNALKTKLESAISIVKKSRAEKALIESLYAQASADVETLKHKNGDVRKKDFIIDSLKSELDKARSSLAMREAEMHTLQQQLDSLKKASHTLIKKYSLLKKEYILLKEEQKDVATLFEQETNKLNAKSLEAHHRHEALTQQLKEKNAFLAVRLAKFEHHLQTAKVVIEKLRAERKNSEENASSASRNRTETTHHFSVAHNEHSPHHGLNISQEMLVDVENKVIVLEEAVAALIKEKEGHEKTIAFLSHKARNDAIAGNTNTHISKKSHEKTEERCQRLETLLNQEQTARLALEDEKNDLLDTISRMEEELELLQRTLKKLNHGNASLEETLKTIRKNLAGSSSEPTPPPTPYSSSDNTNERIASLEQQLSDVTTEKEIILRTLAEERSSTIATNKQSSRDTTEVETLRHRRDAIEHILLEKNLQLDELNKELESIKRILVIGKHDVEEAEQRYNALAAEKNEIEKKYALSRDEKVILEEKISSLEQRLRDAFENNGSSNNYAEELQSYATQLNEIKNTLAEKENALSLLKSSYAELSATKESSDRTSLEASAAHAAALEDQLHDTINALNVAQKNLAEKDEALSALKKIHADAIAAHEEAYSSTRGELHSSITERDDLKNIVHKKDEDLAKQAHIIEKYDALLTEKKHLEEKYAEISEKYHALALQLKSMLDNTVALEEKLRSAEHVASCKQHEIEQHSATIAEISSEQDKLEETITDLQKKAQERETYIKQMQHHMAKKVKETAMLSEHLEQQKSYTLNLQKYVADYKSTLNQQNEKIKILSANEEKTRVIAEERVNAAEKNSRQWEEKYSSLYEKTQRDRQRLEELEQIQAEYRQLRGVLSNIQNVIGGPAQQQQQQSYRDSFEKQPSTKSGTIAQQDIFATQQQSQKHKNTLFSQ